MKISLALALAYSGLLLACMDRDAPPTAQTGGGEAQPGKLSLGTLATAKPGVEKIPLQNSDSIFDYDLGEAGASIQRFFVLKNTGDIDIRDVVLATDNPRFYFSPSRIRILQPSRNVPVLQVITLNIVHGSRLEGLGPDTLLPMGKNSVLARISGRTANAAGDSISVSEAARFQIFAKVLDFNVFTENNVELDAGTAGLDYASMQAFTPDPVRVWGLQKSIQVVNTGNVSFTLKNWRVGEHVKPLLLDSMEVESGGNVRFAPDHVEIDGHGVISNPFKAYAQPARDGKVYMIFGPAGWQ